LCYPGAPCEQLAAAATCLGIFAEFMASLSSWYGDFSWWHIVIISCASVATAAGLAALATQVR